MAERTRTVEGVLHFLTPQQMAEEIVRLDAVLAGKQPNILMGRLPPIEPRFCGYTATGLRRLADGLADGIVECIPGDCTNTQDELDRLGAARVLRALAATPPDGVRVVDGTKQG